MADEVSRLRVVEVHESVRLEHAGITAVGGKGSVAHVGAAEQVAEDLVEVGEETALVGGAAGVGVVGRLEGESERIVGWRVRESEFDDGIVQ